MRYFLLQLVGINIVGSMRYPCIYRGYSVLTEPTSMHTFKEKCGNVRRKGDATHNTDI